MTSFGRAISSSSSTSSAPWCNPTSISLSCAFARLVSIGSATSFEVHGLRQEAAYFTSFYLYSVTRGIPYGLRGQAWPRITRYDDRWRWLVTSVVPRFRRFDANTRLIDASMRRILDDARYYALTPCVLPRVPQPEGGGVNLGARRRKHRRTSVTVHGAWDPQPSALGQGVQSD